MTNFFGWPPASSLMGLQSQATLDDLAEARHHAPATQGDRRNVIVIIVDSLRAGHMSLYGYPRDTTLFLRSFGEAEKLHAVRLALSTCSESYCGIATIMASRHFHQVSRHSFKPFDHLARHGYKKRFFLTGDHVGWSVLKDLTRLIRARCTTRKVWPGAVSSTVGACSPASGRSPHTTASLTSSTAS